MNDDERRHVRQICAGLRGKHLKRIMRVFSHAKVMGFVLLCCLPLLVAFAPDESQSAVPGFDTDARVSLIPATHLATDIADTSSEPVEGDPNLIPFVGRLMIVVIISAVALRFFWLNKQLRHQIRENELVQARYKESEQRYRSLVEAAPFAVVISSMTDNTLRYLNPRAEAQLSLKNDQAVGKPAADFYVHSDDRRQFITTVRETGYVHDYEALLRDAGGQEFWASLSAIAMIYEGKPAIFVTFKDISERRWMEQKLRESEELYRSILHASPDAVTITDLSGKIELVSPAGLRMFRHASEDEVIGQQLSHWISPEQRELAINHLQKILNGANRGTAQYEVTRSDGTNFNVEANGELIRDANDQPSRIVFIIRDVTERKHAEAQTFALAVEQERVKLLTSFIQNASHEFRTPLAIIGSSVYLLAKLTDESKRRRHAEKAEKQIRNITNLVEMLTTLAKLDSGAPLRFTPMDLNVLLQLTVERIEPELTEKEITLHYVNNAADAVIIQADPEPLRTALRNLIENAKRYSLPGGVIALDLSTHEDNAAVIEISDNGTGIDPDDLPRIFERFWREDDMHSTAGFGVGLPLAQKIILAHGGTIEVESTLGIGSLFRIVLPLHTVSPSMMT